MEVYVWRTWLKMYVIGFETKPRSLMCWLATSRRNFSFIVILTTPVGKVEGLWSWQCLWSSCPAHVSLPLTCNVRFGRVNRLIWLQTGGRGRFHCLWTTDGRALGRLGQHFGLLVSLAVLANKGLQGTTSFSVHFHCLWSSTQLEEQEWSCCFLDDCHWVGDYIKLCHFPQLSLITRVFVMSRHKLWPNSAGSALWRSEPRTEQPVLIAQAEMRRDGLVFRGCLVFVLFCYQLFLP